MVYLHKPEHFEHCYQYKECAYDGLQKKHGNFSFYKTQTKNNRPTGKDNEDDEQYLINLTKMKYFKCRPVSVSI
jgi:hypothetical protein